MHPIQTGPLLGASVKSLCHSRGKRILRARAARVGFLEDALAACSSPGREGAACVAAAYLRVLPELIKFSRYEGEALSQRGRGLWIMKQETVLSSGGSSS